MRGGKCAYFRIEFVTFTYKIASVVASGFNIARIRGQWSDMESGVFA